MRILIAEDDPVSRRMLETFLRKWGYEVVVAEDGAQAWEALEKEGAPQLAVLDWMMPGMDGLEICRRVRERGTEPYTYIVLLTTRGQEPDIVRGLDGGANDYLTKPFQAGELRARLRAAGRILELERQLVEARDALRMQASHDALTGLFNRGAVFDVLQRELHRAHRAGEVLTVMMADIDHFKRINDSHGHLVGDAVLIETGRTLQTSLRPYDTVGRYGGEEFLVIFPRCDASEAVHPAERVRLSVAERAVVVPERKLQITASAGIADSRGMTPAEVESLIQAADAALYRAKKNGRNRLEVAAPSDYLNRVAPVEPSQVRTRNPDRLD